MPPPSDFITFVEPSQFEGDRDTKRPSDFNSRTLEDHEEEDDDDEDHAPTRTSKKRTESGSIKPPPPSQSRPQQVSSASPPPNKRARVDSIEIPSEAAPASSSSVPSLPSALLHPSLQPLLAQTLQAHMPSYNPQSSLAHLYNMVQQQSHPSDSPAALLNFLRTAGLQSGRFNSQQSSQHPHLSESFLASLAELASANPGIGDGLGNGLGGYGLGGAGGAFDWPTGLGSGSNPQEPQPSTSSSFLSHVLTHPCLLASPSRPRKR